MREALAQDLAELGYAVRTAVDGAEGLREVKAAQPDLVVSDVNMPHLDGIGLCRALKNDPVLRFIPVVLMTAEPDRETHLKGIAAGADDFFGKPHDHAELAARANVLVRARVLNRALDGTENVLRALATVTAARSPAIVARALRTARIARLLAVAHGFPQEEADLLYSAGMLLDIGMITLPDAILIKSSPLSAEERTLMRQHPVEGERICFSLQSLAFALPVIHHHHERFDGAGYPDGRAGGDIPLGARIAAVADAWDAITHERPYRPQRSPAQAAQVLARRRRNAVGSGVRRRPSRPAHAGCARRRRKRRDISVTPVVRFTCDQGAPSPQRARRVAAKFRYRIVAANRELVEAHLADPRLTGEARDGQPPVVTGGIL